TSGKVFSVRNSKGRQSKSAKCDVAQPATGAREHPPGLGGQWQSEVATPLSSRLNAPRCADARFRSAGTLQDATAAQSPSSDDPPTQIPPSAASRPAK